MKVPRKFHFRHAAETSRESYLATVLMTQIGVKHGGRNMKRFSSYLKGYTLGTLFVLLHVASQGPRLRAENDRAS
jgi:hypothetical protein